MKGIYIDRTMNKDVDAEYRVLRANGEIRWIREISIARWNPTAKENQAIGVLQDITEQKKFERRLLASKNSLEAIVVERTRAQKRLEESESWYVMAASTAKLGHWHFDELNDVYLNISDQYADIFGYSADEFLRRFSTYDDDMTLVHPDDAERVDKEYDLGQDYMEIDYRIRHADGEIRHVREISKYIRDDSGTLIETMGTLQDVTELKQAQLEAEHANLAKSEFLSRMSHELRTPLNAILGFAELVGIDDSIGQKTRSGMREISRAGKHLLILIDEILDLSGIEAGEVEMSIEPVLVIDLITDSLIWVADLAKNRGISIDCDLASFGGLSVLADATRLKQVFLNLLSNAVKYNLAAGRVTIIRDTATDGLARIGIRDTGPGISENQKSQLFQPFNRLGAENSTIEGTGIGLVITRRLMDLMQGHLEVDSVPGKGSTFWIELPDVQLLEAQAADSVEPGSSKESTQTMPTGMPRILVAEDNKVNLLLIEAQMEELEYQADFVENGVEALKLWQSEKYNLLMTDIRMPLMDGYELISRIRSQEDGAGKASPIVVISANAMDDDVKRCIEAGADDVMSKPFGLEDLRKTVKKWALMH
jgi:PAS domain S-box-containing protein